VAAAMLNAPPDVAKPPAVLIALPAAVKTPVPAPVMPESGDALAVAALPVMLMPHVPVA